MLKMFTTQLSGLFKRIQEKEESSFEDGARLLAQAPAGDGKIYIYSAKEMKAVEYEALEGAEPFTHAEILSDASKVTEADRVLIFSRSANDQDAVELAKKLRDQYFPFVAVSTVFDGEGGLETLADVHINLGLKKGLLPDELGNRFAYPSSMAALYVYYGLKFTIEEILSEYEE